MLAKVTICSTTYTEISEGIFEGANLQEIADIAAIALNQQTKVPEGEKWVQITEEMRNQYLEKYSHCYFIKNTYYYYDDGNRMHMMQALLHESTTVMMVDEIKLGEFRFV